MNQGKTKTRFGRRIANVLTHYLNFDHFEQRKGTLCNRSKIMIINFSHITGSIEHELSEILITKSLCLATKKKYIKTGYW